MAKGIVLAFLAFAVFAWGDAVVKEIGYGLDPFEVTFFGYLIPFLLSPVFMKPGDQLIDIVRWNRPWLMGLRVFLIAATTPLSVIAFRSLPFAEAFALLFLMPSLVTILSIFILKEHVRWRRGLAVCAAFIGVLIIVRPGFKELLPGHIAALAAALCAAGGVITGRLIGQSEKRFTLIGTVFLATTLLAGILMIPGFAWPTGHQWILLLAFAATAFVAQALFVVATMYAPADRLGAAQYSQILWALAIGALFFDEWPDALALLGIFIVVAAGLFIFAREQTLKRGHSPANASPEPASGGNRGQSRPALTPVQGATSAPAFVPPPCMPPYLPRPRAPSARYPGRAEVDRVFRDRRVYQPDRHGGAAERRPSDLHRLRRSVPIRAEGQASVQAHGPAIRDRASLLDPHAERES